MHNTYECELITALGRECLTYKIRSRHRLSRALHIVQNEYANRRGTKSKPEKWWIITTSQTVHSQKAPYTMRHYILCPLAKRRKNNLMRISILKDENSKSLSCEQVLSFPFSLFSFRSMISISLWCQYVLVHTLNSCVSFMFLIGWRGYPPHLLWSQFSAACVAIPLTTWESSRQREWKMKARRKNINTLPS